MIAVLNELSLQQQPNEALARAMMENFVEAFSAASRYFSQMQILRLFSTIPNFFMATIAPDYTVQNFTKDGRSDEVARTRLKTIIIKQTITWDEEDEKKSEIDDTIFCHNNQDCKGLGLAYLEDQLAISLASDAIWNNINIDLIKKTIAVDGENWEVEPITVRHFSTKEHFKYHRAWLQEKQDALITSGNDLWDRKELLYPKLRFCGDTENQLRAGHGQTHLDGVKEILGMLNVIAIDLEDEEKDFIVDWVKANYLIDISGESDSTMNQPKLVNYRKFNLWSGRSEIFELHAKGADLRIHIFPERTDGEMCIYIGCIVSHLPT